VGEISTGKISVFPVDTAGGAPFGASFTASRLFLVTDVMNPSAWSYPPFGGRADCSQRQGCQWRDGSVLDDPVADAHALYTSKSGIGTLLSYGPVTHGTLVLGAAAASILQGAGSGNIDGGVTSDGQYLYGRA
jgi:hypothetical protein